VSVPSAEIPDLSREHKACWSWHPARALLASLRAYEQHSDSVNPVSWLLKKLAVLRHRFCGVITGADIPLGSKIAGGLLLPRANVVVLVDVPDNCMAVGIPAVVKPRQRQED